MKSKNKPGMFNHVHRQRHPDDHFFDHGEIVLVERYKESGLSGDEWRFSWIIKLFRKDRLLATKTCGGTYYQLAAIELARGIALGGEILMDLHKDWEVVQKWDPNQEEGICCQPGCIATATIKYRMKSRFDLSCFFSSPIDNGEIYYREFCDRHKERGDGGLDDGMGNYEILETLPC